MIKLEPNSWMVRVKRRRQITCKVYCFVTTLIFSQNWWSPHIEKSSEKFNEWNWPVSVFVWIERTLKAKEPTNELFMNRVNNSGDLMIFLLRYWRNIWSVKYVLCHHYNSISNETTILLSKHDCNSADIHSPQPNIQLYDTSLLCNTENTIQLHNWTDFYFMFYVLVIGKFNVCTWRNQKYHHKKYNIDQLCLVIFLEKSESIDNFPQSFDCNEIQAFRKNDMV